MTAPPGETGASADGVSSKLPEAQSIENAVQALMYAIWPNHCHEHDLNGHDCGDRISEEAARAWIRDALLAAKRSAHLEDAMAGCWRCREEGQPVQMTQYGPGWWHPDNGRPVHAITCARPEVWDALSRGGE